MKIIATLDDVCRSEDWYVTHHPYIAVQTYPPDLTAAKIKGETLLTSAANQHVMPGVITIPEAEILRLPHTIYMGFALLDENAKEVWLGLSEQIYTAIKEAEFEACEIPEGMSAYYLLEFDLGES